MTLFHLSGYTNTERENVRSFWHERYHSQAERPVTMSPDRQQEGGYGAWDAGIYARDLKYKALNDKKLAQTLDLFKETPEWNEHPVSREYLKRRADLIEERRKSCGADKDRLDLQMNAEAKGYKAWMTKEHFGHRQQEPSAKRLLDEAERNKDQAFTELYRYDRKHSHPLTDPNRNLAKDPPDVSERRKWMIEREAMDKYGVARQPRRFDDRNDTEMAGLGMMPKNWMDEQQLKQANRQAPVHSGKVVPERMERSVAQRQEVDRLTGTRRNLEGQAIGRDWSHDLRQKTTDEKRQATTSFRKEQIEVATRSNRQGTESVADTRASQDKIALVQRPAALGDLLAARRANAVAEAPKEERRMTLGQQIYKARMDRETEQAAPKPQQNKDQPKVAQATPAKPAVEHQAPPVSKERAHAERVSERFGRMHQNSDSIRVAKMSSPDHMQKVLEIRKHTPKPTPAARVAASKPVNAKPGSQKWYSGIQQRANDFKTSMGKKWDVAMTRVPGTEQARNAAAQQRIEARAQASKAPAVKGPKPNPAVAKPQQKRDPYEQTARKGPSPNPVAAKPRPAPTQEKAKEERKPVVAAMPPRPQSAPQPVAQASRSTPTPMMRGTSAESTMVVQLRHRENAVGPKPNPQVTPQRPALKDQVEARRASAPAASQPTQAKPAVAQQAQEKAPVKTVAQGPKPNPMSQNRPLSSIPRPTTVRDVGRSVGGRSM